MALAILAGFAVLWVHAADSGHRVQDALCEPLARFLIGIARGSGDQIRDFSFHLVAQNNITKKGIEDLSFNEN